MSLLTDVAWLLDEWVILPPLLVLVGLLLDRGKRSLPYLVVSAVLTLLLKKAFAVSRVCEGLEVCTEGFAFPSGHAALTSALAFSRYGKREFFPLLLLAIFVGYTRIVLGFHTWPEVFAGIVLSSFLLELEKLALIKKGW